MKEAILKLIEERKNVSFAELEDKIEGFTGGDSSVEIKDKNLILWLGMTKDGAKAINDRR